MAAEPLSRRAANSTDAVQVTASRQTAPSAWTAPGQCGENALLACRSAAPAGETSEASANTAAARVASMAVAGCGSSGGLHRAPTADPTSRATAVLAKAADS